MGGRGGTGLVLPRLLVGEVFWVIVVGAVMVEERGCAARTSRV